MNDYIHILGNIIILWIGIGIWYGNRKITKKIKNTEPTYSDFLYKLHLILNKSEYDIFVIAAREGGFPEYTVEDAFKRYCQDGTMPRYLTEFLDQGKDQIINYKIKTWIF